MKEEKRAPCHLNYWLVNGSRLSQTRHPVCKETVLLGLMPERFLLCLRESVR